MIQLLITDRNMVVQGDPVDGWTALDVELRFNEPGPGSVRMPARPEVMAQLRPGNRLVVIRNGAIWAAGPLEAPQDYTWDLDSAPGPGTVSVHFAGDLALIAGRVTYPDPALPAGDPGQPAYRAYPDRDTAAILRDLVSTNCGPTALAERRIPGLDLGTRPGSAAGARAPSVVTWRTRFQPLAEALREVAAMDGLGFRVRQEGRGLFFDVYEPEDRTATARFSRALGNLRSLHFRRSAPLLTHAIVGGGGEGADRIIAEAEDVAAENEWYRVEQFLDSRGAEDDSQGELTRAGKAALAEGAQPVRLVTTTVDTEDLRAGRDYSLGDRVTVALPEGLEVTDVVRAIHLRATPDEGERVTSLVGSPESTTDTRSVHLIRELGRRLGRLEAR